MNGKELLDRIRPVEHRLDNGLTLLVREDHSSPVVAIVTHVRAGYFDEPDPLVGISHVLEHMYFKGTDRRGVGEIARATKSAGGYLNAGTIYDHTSYYTVLPADAVDMGLDIQADALIHSRIDAAELEKELRVIIEEVRRKLDNPSAMATEKLYEAMFDTHPIRRWRMGTEEGLKRLRRADVVDYYRTMYRGGNTTLVVAGDVDPGRVIERVEALYAPVSPGEPERPGRDPEPDRRGARFRELSGDIAHSYVELGWRTPGVLHEDTPVLDALAVVLGQGRASRLYRGVREAGLASRVDAYNYTPTEIGVFGIGVECEPRRTAPAIGAALAEVARLADDVEDEELERVRTLLQARLLRRLESVEGQANLLAEWQAVGGWDRVAEYVDGVRAVSPERVAEAAARYLRPDATTALVYRPESAAAVGWTDDRLARVAAGERQAAVEPDAEVAAGGEGTGAEEADDGEAAGAEEADDGEAAGASSAATGVAPGPGAAAPVPAPVTLGTARREDGVVDHAMDGGRLIVKPRSRAPLVSMAVFRRGGVLHEDVATAGITGLMMRTSVKGTATRSAHAIALAAERLGGSIGASAGSDLLSWTLTVPAEHFAEGFDLLADVAQHASFPAAEVARERDVLLADLERLRDDMYRYPLRLLLHAAFGDHPYGRSPETVAAAVAGLEAADLRRWHAEELAEPWVFVVGDVDPGRVADTVAERFGTTTRSIGRAPAAPEWPEGPRREEDRRDRAQTALAVGFPGPSRGDPDRIPLEVLSAAISGLGNRLFEELRSRRSLAYTVSAYPLVRRHAGAFVGYIATANARAEEARTALLEELGRLRETPPTAEELERARRYAIGAWQIRTQTNGAQLSELASALMLGEGLEEIREYESRVRGVTRERVLEAARRWLDESRLVEGVVRGGAVVD